MPGRSTPRTATPRTATPRTATPRSTRRRAASAAALVVLLAAAGASAAAGAAPPVPAGLLASDVTSDLEAARVDAVATPDPGWFDCSAVFGTEVECGSVTVPLDYDDPQGATTDVALLRARATDPDARVGSLVVNPGGPGGSGVQMAAMAQYSFSPNLRAHFDIVGLDPRGTNFSTAVRCFRDVGAQQDALTGLQVAFPVGETQTGAYLASARELGEACAAAGSPLAGSMSTAQVARDMDVVRRALGEEHLTYLGFSYGSYVGQVYANMFPDRVRALAVDGVLDPVAWAGTTATAGTPVSARHGAPPPAPTLDEVWRRCAQAGPDLCRTAGIGDPQEVWQGVADGLQDAAVVVPDPTTGEVVRTVTWATAVELVLGALYSSTGPGAVDELVWALHWMQQPETPDNVDLRTAARVALIGYGRALDLAAREHAAAQSAGARAFGVDFPYPNGTEAYAAVLCTDSRNPADPSAWVGAAERAQQAAGGFGPSWSWASAPCATRTWTAQDEDRWTGPFDAVTAAPVLVVGNLWDPATAYEGARAAAELLPHSRLVTSDSWGHTAYGSSRCVTDAIEDYLVEGTVPSEGTTCVGDAQPFTARALAGEDGPQPRVVPPLPGALPRVP